MSFGRERRRGIMVSLSSHWSARERPSPFLPPGGPRFSGISTTGEAAGTGAKPWDRSMERSSATEDVRIKRLVISSSTRPAATGSDGEEGKSPECVEYPGRDAGKDHISVSFGISPADFWRNSAREFSSIRKKCRYLPGEGERPGAAERG